MRTGLYGMSKEAFEVRLHVCSLLAVRQTRSIMQVHAIEARLQDHHGQARQRQS